MRLHAALEQAGHDVFVDKEIEIGVKWAAELERQIKACDFIVVLLSSASVHSEMVEAEIRCAHRHHEQQETKSCLLPVRVNYFDALPYQLSAYLDPLQYAAWHDNADDATLISQLLSAIQGARLPLSSEVKPALPSKTDDLPSTPPPYADPRFVESLREPAGAIGLGSKFYIKQVPR